MSFFPRFALVLTPLLAACSESHHNEAVKTTDNFAEFGCQYVGGAEDAARRINASGQRFDATAEVHVLTAGGPGKVVVVQRGARGSDGVQVILLFKANDRGEVTATGTKTGPPSDDDRRFISSILEIATLQSCIAKDV
ncbi:hypothetical protein [Sphingopyxis sp. KK2]|uniref:hypothetical protein n=1 Tax=Sphingopyxis sp. KK2 TaxID=1855727 RepID=UPI00097E6655|nr:hypothetical protein [Sphingopyxis sp. KK2]